MANTGKGGIFVSEKKDPIVGRDELMKLIARNLNKLKTTMGWTQAKMSSLTDVAEPTTANYLRGERMPSLEYLINLCNLEEIKAKKIELRIDDFLSSSFDPGKAQSIKNKTAEGLSDIADHRDFTGIYFCYFYDQSKSESENASRGSRELRFGVLSVFDDYNCITGEKKMMALAAFYKEKDFESVAIIKSELENIFSSDESIAARNAAITDFYTRLDDGVYFGEVSFTSQHIFVSLQSRIHSDTALMILYSPPKRTDSSYIGGAGSIASVAHGRDHMPSAQKIIISRYELMCSFEEISDHLVLAPVSISAGDEAKELVSMCTNLFSKDLPMSLLLDETDKTAIIENRLNQLVKSYIEKSACCVASVSSEDDRNVYELIYKYKNAKNS